jgi:hypothetical protein
MRHHLRSRLVLVRYANPLFHGRTTLKQRLINYTILILVPSGLTTIMITPIPPKPYYQIRRIVYYVLDLLLYYRINETPKANRSYRDT